MSEDLLRQLQLLEDDYAGQPPVVQQADLREINQLRAQLGMPAVNYGPGISEIAHTAGEYVELDAIGACEARLRAWLGC